MKKQVIQMKNKICKYEDGDVEQVLKFDIVDLKNLDVSKLKFFDSFDIKNKCINKENEV